MHEKICSFCGHRDVISNNLSEKVEKIICELIEKHGYNTFYSGHMGEFDELCERVVKKLKNKYMNIRLCRILPYYKHKLSGSFFDEIIIPDLGNVHYKRAITARNQWMAKKSDLVLCYIYKDHGGAWTMKKYAEKIEKNCINAYEN